MPLASEEIRRRAEAWRERAAGAAEEHERETCLRLADEYDLYLDHSWSPQAVRPSEPPPST